MTPFVPFAPPTANPPRALPGAVKAILGLKVIGCLFTLGVSLLILSAASGTPMPADTARVLGNLLMMVSGAALLELIAIAGVWSLKRWGVYLLACFGCLELAVDMRAGMTASAAIGIASLLFTAFAIAARWKDFE